MANLSGANFADATLFGTNFSKAKLVGAALSGANCWRANFKRANLRNAELSYVNFQATNLLGADLNYSFMDETIFADNDLSVVKGLETVEHLGPSVIGIDTIHRSKGKIPEVFLRGAGVPDSFIAEMKFLVGTATAIEFYSCFISYSTKDREFAERLHADLQDEHIRCWFAPENLKIGDRFRSRIDEAIRIYDKLLLILSKNSIHSPWVEKEVETAFEKERKSPGKTVLFPIRLDDAVMKTDQAWAADIRRTRHIGDFSHWKSHNQYKVAFDRFLRDLKAEDKPRVAPKKGRRN